MTPSLIVSKRRISSGTERPKASCRYQKMIPPSYGRRYKSVWSHTDGPDTLLRSANGNGFHSDKRSAFDPIAQKLLYAQGAPLRHIPLKLYLPSSPSAAEPLSGHLRVIQSLVTPYLHATGEPQTLGTALHGLVPALFPSRKTPIHAKPVLHGAVVPMSSPVEALLTQAAYLDGWLHLGLVMMA